MMRMSENETKIKCVFLCQFHPVQGPTITYQVRLLYNSWCNVALGHPWTEAKVLTYLDLVIFRLELELEVSY